MALFKRRDDKADEIDLRPTERRPVWGRPTRCPACGDAGYLDHIDLVDRVMRQHCTTCHTSWVTEEAECAVRRAGPDSVSDPPGR